MDSLWASSLGVGGGRRACKHRLRSGHTRQKVTATRRRDKSQQQFTSCDVENICENLCSCDRIFFPMTNHTNSNWFEFMPHVAGKNSVMVMGTKIFTKLLQSELLQRLVPTSFRSNLFWKQYTPTSLSQRPVAVTECRDQNLDAKYRLVDGGD